MKIAKFSITLGLLSILAVTQLTFAAPVSPPPSPNLPDANFNKLTISTSDASWAMNVVNNESSTNTAAQKGGISGTTYNQTGLGLLGQNLSGTSSLGAGVYGYATNNPGVYGYSANGVGTVGYSTSNTGVYGISSTGTGVQGTSTNGFGVYGLSTNSPAVIGASTNNASIFGNASSNAGSMGGLFTRTLSANAARFATANNAIEAVGEIAVSGNTKGISFAGAGSQALLTKGTDLFTSGTYSGLGRFGVFYDTPGDNMVLGIPNSATKYLTLAAYNTNSTKQDYLRMDNTGAFDNPKQTAESAATCTTNGGYINSTGNCDYPIYFNDYGGLKIRSYDTIPWFYGITEINSRGIKITSTDGQGLEIHASSELPGAYTHDFTIDNTGIVSNTRHIGGGSDHVVQKYYDSSPQDTTTDYGYSLESLIDSGDNTTWNRGVYSTRDYRNSIYNIGARTVRIGNYTAVSSSGSAVPAFSTKATFDNFNGNATVNLNTTVNGTATGSSAALTANLPAAYTGNGVNAIVDNASSYAINARNNSNGLGVYAYSNAGTAVYASSSAGTAVQAYGKVNIAYPTSSNVALDVNGRIKTGDSNNLGGVWVNDGLTQFFGQYNSTVVGIWNSGWRLMIDSSGNVGIATSSPSYKLHVNGSVAGVGAYNNISDARFKKDLKPIENALEKVLKLKGFSFGWDQEKFPKMDFKKGRDVGFIAQDVLEILPEAVSQDKDGYYSLAYGEFAPLLSEAIKQLNAIVEGVDGRVESLEKENKELKVKLTSLEERLSKLETSRR